MAERLELQIWLDNGQLKVATKESEQAFANMGNGINKSGTVAASGLSKISSGLSAITTMAKGFIALQVVQFLFDIGKAAFKGASELEKNKMAFETMLGSGQKATKMMGDIQKMAAATPFETPGLVDAAKKLLAFGIAQEEIIPTMTRLGDASQGNQEIFDRLALAYGKVAAKGRASMEELNMFTEAGVPLNAELAKKFGDVYKASEQGAIGFSHVKKAMEDLTTGSGQFAGLMEKQAQSLGGLFSTLSDNVKMNLTSAATDAEGPMKMLLSLFVEGSQDGNWFSTAIKGVGIVVSVTIGFINEMIISIQRLWAGAEEIYYKSRAFLAESKTEEKAYNEKAQLAENRGANLEAKSAQNIQLVRQSIGLEEKPASSSGPGRSSTAIKDSSGGGAGSGKKLTRESYDMEFGSADQMEKELKQKEQLLQQYHDRNIINEQEYGKAMQKVEGDYAQKKIAQYGQMAVQILNIAKDMVDQLAEVYKQQDEQEMASLDRRREMGLAFIEFQRQNALNEAGIVTQTKSQQYQTEISELQKKYNKEHNTQKKADLKKQIQEKQNKKKEAEINEEAEKQKAQFELMMQLIKHQVAVRQFKRNQQMQMAQATISMLTGSVQAFTGAMSLGFPMGLIIGAIQAAAVLAMGGVNIGLIAAQQPPAFEKGGFIQGSPTGTTINVGEKNKSELVLPVDDPDAMARVRNALGVGDSGTTIIVQGSVVDAHGLLQVVDDARNKKAARIGGSNYVMGNAYR